MVDPIPVGNISLDEPETEGTVSLDPVTGPPVPPPAVATQRAIKADYSWGTGSPGAPTIYSGISTGNEMSLRQGRAVDENIDFIQQRNKLISEIAAQHGGAIDAQSLAVLYDMQKADFQSDPKDVFERKFAEKFHTDALKVNETNSQSPVRKMMAEDPEKALDYTDMAQTATAIREYAKTKLEDTNTEWDKTGVISKGLQYGGQFMPFLSAWNLHGLLAEKDRWQNILPGENLGQGVDNLLRQPYPVAIKMIDEAVAKAGKMSTLDAQTLLNAIIRYTSSDSTLNNIVGLTDAGGFANLAGKGLYKAVSGTGKLADRISLARAARQRATSAATVEDTAQAAVQEMQKEIGITPSGTRVFHIPEAAAKNLETVRLDEKGVVKGFTDAQGTVSRNLDNFVYVTPKEAKALEGADRLVELSDGRLAKSVKQPDGQFSLPFPSSTVAAKNLPEEGLVPVFVGKTQKFNNQAIYSDIKIGTPIKSVERADPEPIFYTDVKNNVTVAPGKAGEGMVPVSVDPDGTIRFGPTQRGEVYHIPREVAKGMVPQQKFGRPPEYRADFNKDGKPVFYVGPKKNRVFSHDVPEGPGTVAVSVSKSGRVEFLATGAEKDFQKAVADASKAVAQPELKLDEVMSQIGDHDKAATIKAVTKATTPTPEKVIQDLPSAMNPANFFGKGSAMSAAWAARMIERMGKDTGKLFDALGKLYVTRLTPEALQIGIEESKNSLKRVYGGRVNDGIAGFLHIPPELNPNKANLDTVIMRLGDLNARPFESRAAAELYRNEIYKLTDAEATIGQQGSSFYIQLQRFVDEESDAVRQAMVTPTNSTPVSMWNMALNRLRTSEDLLSDLQRNNRRVATHAPQIINKLLREQIDSTSRALTRQQRKNVEEILRLNRDEINPALGPDKRGVWYATDADFEKAYYDKFGKMPTDKEIEHYFNYTRVSDYDYTIRNLALYRDKGRIGIEQFSFRFPDAKGNLSEVPFLEGKELEKFPWGGQNAGILIADSAGETRLLYKHGTDKQLDTTVRKTVDELIKDRGFKIVQVFDPTKRPLSGIEFSSGKIEEQIHFIVTDTVSRKPLAFQQLEYRPGGHSIYLDDWYVKQPQIMKGQRGRDTYYGDNAVMNFASEAEARKYAERMDIARVMVKNNDPRLEAFLASNLPYHVDTFRGMFNKGHLNLDAPIVYARSGTSTFDTVTSLKSHDYRELVDATKSEYNLAGSIDTSYTAERNLVLDTVIEKNGFMAIAPSRQLDPYAAMNRALGQGVRNLWMNDYKISAVQNWLQEFGDVMKPDFKQLSNNPMYFLYNPQWNEAVVDKARLAAAKANQRALVNFVGARSELGGQIEFMQNKLLDSIYGKLGQDKAQWFGDHMLPAIKDPASYARAVAFHSKLGFFNPVQMFVQMQSLANVMALAGPVNGFKGAGAAYLMRRLAHTGEKAIIDDFAQKATAFGWKKDEFLEMYDAFRKSGLYEVAGEAALRDDVFDPKLFRSTFGAFLDKGTMFFNEGERAVRMSAFAAAYQEWKIANPGIALTNRELGKVMTRSDTLSASMTRASAAQWQNGLLSIPTQFLAYNARIAEQFFSKRLTTQEKLRAFGLYSTLYGVPSTIGAVVGVWPFYEDIREEAIKRGVNVHDNFYKVFSEGVLSAGFSMITGKDYNFSQRYAPGGTTMFRDLIRGDKGFFETMGGPSASIMGDIIKTTFPLGRSLWELTRGQSEDFPTRKEDWWSIATNVSTLGLATRIYTAVEYGKYISKNNVQVGNMDNMDAMMAVLGVSPQQIADTYLTSKANKEDMQAKKSWEDAALKEYSLGMSALKRGDYTGYKDYMSRFNTYMTNDLFTIEDRIRIEERAASYTPDLDEKVMRDYYSKAPKKYQEDRFKSMQNFFKNKVQ